MEIVFSPRTLNNAPERLRTRQHQVFLNSMSLLGAILWWLADEMHPRLNPHMQR